ncbi:unnamed protein product [Microthlaspi erraticum]|uniref:Uncharacterized protein n=1 Tax=Microthlaspi erraticum TaxID=1685480 RepID=A0A6D2JP57_9BRAS|nr:unnamed protein product [Microthlaspi erraticum]
MNLRLWRSMEDLKAKREDLQSRVTREEERGRQKLATTEEVEELKSKEFGEVCGQAQTSTETAVIEEIQLPR